MLDLINSHTLEQLQEHVKQMAEVMSIIMEHLCKTDDELGKKIAALGEKWIADKDPEKDARRKEFEKSMEFVGNLLDRKRKK